MYDIASELVCILNRLTCRFARLIAKSIQFSTDPASIVCKSFARLMTKPNQIRNTHKHIEREIHTKGKRTYFQLQRFLSQLIWCPWASFALNCIVEFESQAKQGNFLVVHRELLTFRPTYKMSVVVVVGIFCNWIGPIPQQTQPNQVKVQSCETKQSKLHFATQINFSRLFIFVIAILY